MKILLGIALCVMMAVSAFAGKAVEKFVTSSSLDSTSVAVMIIDLADGSILESYNSSRPLIPASVMKTITIASLIDAVGIDYCYRTRVCMQGECQDSVLNGNIFVVGGGDPSLGATTGPYSSDIIDEIVTALLDKGINTIKGSVAVDQSIFPAPATQPTWAKEDLKYGYGAGCFGLNFENNCYTKGSQSYSVSDPSSVFISRLKKQLAQNGIAIGSSLLKVTKKQELLVEHKSPTIDEIMRHCMRVSDNMFAETMLRTLALVDGQTASTANGVKLENALWERHGLDFDGVDIVDGSGLSRCNRMTADFLANMLKEMSTNVDYVSFFPLAGQEGTLKSFLKDTALDSYIALKTGSMRGIQCYAGYKLDEDYAPTHVVVIMINNFKGSRSQVKSLCETMLLQIFNN